MKKTVKNILQVLIGFIIGAYLLWITLKEQNFDEIMASIKETDIFWAIMGGLCLLAVFVIRAYRWKIILDNSNIKAKFVDITNCIAVGYFVNIFTPKFGELVRCTNLKRTSDVKVSKVLGTVVSERVWDVLVLGVGVVIILLFEFDRLASLFNISELFSGFSNGTLILGLVLGGLMLLVVVFYFVFKERINQWKPIAFIINFISELYGTVLLTFKIKKYRLFLWSTLLIWVALGLMNYCYLMALDETAESGMYFAFVVLMIGGIGWAIPTPGGVGSTHYLILQLFIAFELSQTAGIHFGILSNGLNMVYTILVGIIAVVYNEIRVHKYKKLQDVRLEKHQA